MNRLERISSILIYLQSRSVITAQQIANKFEISLRTVYRDIRVLEESGIPIAGSAGIGYSLVEGYKLPPLMFTTEEAIAFLMAEKLIKRNTDKESSGHFQLGMNKIRAVLRSVEKNLLEDIDNYIKVSDEPCGSHPESPGILQPILQCIIQKKEAVIKYFSNYNQQITTRTIEPLGICYTNRNWYLVAFCLLRNDYRIFKVKRIHKITSGEKAYTSKHPDIDTLLRTLYHDDESCKIIINVKKEALSHIADTKYYYGLYNEVEQGDYVTQYYATFSLIYFARWYLSFADMATIEEPTELKEIVKEIVSNIKIPS